jgi:hypothetical protein
MKTLSIILKGEFTTPFRDNSRSKGKKQGL